jgi:protein-L-isoaspartate(D-aspartate) O-methyltransferase
MPLDQLIRELTDAGVLTSANLVAAFRKIDRADFVPEKIKNNAYFNAPLPIGFGQTISQPLTVAFMLELLEPTYGHKVLDIGSGSGWQTALLSYLVSEDPLASKKSPTKKGKPGQVFALEIVPKLHQQGIINISKYDYLDKGVTKMICQNASPGLPEEAPFDRIIAAAAVSSIPSTWIDQLKPGGRLVAPVKNSIVLIEKDREGSLTEKEFPGFAFVPFIDN